MLGIALSAWMAVVTAPAYGVQFVADQVTQTGGHVHRASLYHRDDMWRIEHNDPGSIEVTIVRKDKGLMWLLVGRTRQFATVPFDGSTGVTLERAMARIPSPPMIVLIPSLLVTRDYTPAICCIGLPG